MIIWFSGSGNSLAVARKLSEATQDSLMHLNDALAADLSGEKVIGLVYPTYSYDAPLKVKEMLGSIRFPKDAYLWVVVTCGSTQAGLFPAFLSPAGHGNPPQAHDEGESDHHPEVKVKDLMR